MPRISLVEAYNNRDVIAWLVKHQDAIDEMMNILQNIDPDGDLTNVVLRTGDQTIDGVKTFIGKIVANCDIIQNGAAYETHAEQIFTKNDYIVMREGALGGLQPGDYSGFRINKYDSVHDGHLVMDSNGVARVGDVGDERPLLVRDEAAYLNAGDVLLWDSVDQKAIGQPKDTVPTTGSTAPVTSDGLKTAFDNVDLAISAGTSEEVTGFTVNPSVITSGTVKAYRAGKTVVVYFQNVSYTAGAGVSMITGLPPAIGEFTKGLTYFTGSDGAVHGTATINTSGELLLYASANHTTVFDTFVYIAA